MPDPLPRSMPVSPEPDGKLSEAATLSARLARSGEGVRTRLLARAGGILDGPACIESNEALPGCR